LYYQKLCSDNNPIPYYRKQRSPLGNWKLAALIFESYNKEKAGAQIPPTEQHLFCGIISDDTVIANCRIYKQMLSHYSAGRYIASKKQEITKKILQK